MWEKLFLAVMVTVSLCLFFQLNGYSATPLSQQTALRIEVEKI